MTRDLKKLLDTYTKPQGVPIRTTKEQCNKTSTKGIRIGYRTCILEKGHRGEHDFR